MAKSEVKDITIKMSKSDMKWSSGYPKPKKSAYVPGEAITLKLKVKNVGDAACAKFVTRFHGVEDGKRLYGWTSWDATPPLAPGKESVEWEWELPDSKMPSTDLILRCDVYGADEPSPW